VTVRVLIFSLFSIAVTSLIQVQDTAALGLKIAPLQYKTTLEKDERKQGFIDISNPSASAVVVDVEVQALRQTNDSGQLEFYDDPQVAFGLTPELKTFQLESREAIRMFFTADGTKLPEGDIHAAMMFSTEPPKQKAGVGQNVRVGTIISIINGNVGPRQADIVSVTLPFFTTSQDVTGEYRIKNTSDEQSSGFYPEVTIAASSVATKKDEASLLFGGRTRVNEFTVTGLGVGLHTVRVSYGDSAIERKIIVLPVWVMIVLAIVVLVVLTELYLLKRKRRKKVHQQG
jgi:hypothetical protein